MSAPRAAPPKALVLAAGLGSRIRAIAGDLPKPLIAFGGQPILIRNLRWLAASGVETAWINLHFAPAAIGAAVGDGSPVGLKVRYVYEPTLLGTAGALGNLAEVFTETMLVVYGDNLVNFDLCALLERHRGSGAMATAALFDQGRHRHTGIAGGRVELDAAGAVTGFSEGGGGTGLVNAGVYALEPGVLGLIPPSGASDFGRDVFPRMLAEGLPLIGHVMEDGGYCLGLDTPESFARGLELLEAGLAGGDAGRALAAPR